MLSTVIASRKTPWLLQRCRRLWRRHFTVAIDGPAASGKSSTARAVAQDLGFGYIDSGSIYRCVTLLALRKDLIDGDDKSQEAALTDLIKNTSIDIRIATQPRHSGVGRVSVPDVTILMNKEDVSQEIRKPEVNQMVARIASYGSVRRAVLDIQHSLASRAESEPTVIRDKETGKEIAIPGGVVMDGRDIGTTIFPNAELKIYLDASAMARAIRRWDQQHGNVKSKGASEGTPQSVEDIAKELEQRDYEDINREHSPLRIAPDAVVIDNTNMTFEQQVYGIADMARERLGIQHKHDDV